MSWFMTQVKRESSISEAVLITLIGIPSDVVTFLGFNKSIILLISSVLASGNVKLSLVLAGFLISITLVWFSLCFKKIFNCISI